MAESSGFVVPDELTSAQVETLFEVWSEFVSEATNAHHTPNADCEECVSVFNGFINLARDVTADDA
jgi:hypothetical protein